MTASSLRSRLRAGDRIVANFSIIAAPAIVELLGLAGFDAVVLDMEHGPLGPESLNVMIPAAKAAGIAPLVRVRTNDASLIGAALDAGAEGVIVPQVNSAAAAAAAVAGARFGPLGQRGVNPFVRAAGYTAAPGWFARANEETALLLMIEGADGVAALPQILEVPGFDGVFVGPFDLSQALGVSGEVEHPVVIEKVREIVAATRTRGMATAVFAATPAAARRWLDLGVALVGLGVDSQLALQGFRAARETLG